MSIHDVRNDWVDALPESDDDQWGRVLRTYAEAMLLAQTIEVGAVGVLAVSECVKADSFEPLQQTVAKFSGLPLGATLTALKKGPFKEKSVVSALESVLDVRNELAHRYFVERVPSMMAPDTHAALQRELEDRRQHIQDAHSEVDAFIAPFMEQLSPEEVEGMLNMMTEPGFHPYKTDPPNIDAESAQSGP